METWLAILDIIVLLFFSYVLFFREYVLRRREVKCLRCGNCCRLLVELEESDIKRIKDAGYKDFLVKDKYLKRINRYCIFLKKEGNIYTCQINNIKPEICNSFPKKRGIFGKRVDSRCYNYHFKLG